MKDASEDRMRAKTKQGHRDGDGNLVRRERRNEGNWSENKTVCCMKASGRERACEKGNYPVVLASVGAG